jgi:hypothetical protein
MPRGIKNAKDTPVLTTNIIEASEQPLGHTVRVPTKDSQVGEPKLVAVAERMPDPEKLANLSFMNEKVTIRVGTSSDPNAEQVFELNIGGRLEFFRRGETKTLPRYYVDHMARMKVTSYSQREVLNEEGVKQVLNVPHTALKYDFAMVSDANPMGADWLKATLAMAG